MEKKVVHFSISQLTFVAANMMKKVQIHFFHWFQGPGKIDDNNGTDTKKKIIKKLS